MDTADMASQREEEGEPGLILKEPAALEEDGLGRTGERGERGVEDSSSSCSYWLALYYNESACAYVCTCVCECVREREYDVLFMPELHASTCV